jgi:hypothetical protein
LSWPVGSQAIRRGLRAFARDLPIWFLAYLGWSTFNLVLKNLSPPRPEFAWTAIFPLAWVVAFLWWCRGKRTAGRLIGACAAVGAPLALMALAPAQPMSSEEIRPWFEFGTLLGVALLATHCWFTRPRAEFALFYGVGVVFGLILENGGIAMGFFSETGYRLHLPGFPGPLATGLGWTSVFYVATFIAERFFPSAPAAGAVWRPALLATAVALSLDLQLDPAATAAGWWVWHPSLTPGYLGVPLVNYTAWLAAIGPFFVLLWWIRAQGWPQSRQNLVLLSALAPLLLAELVIVMALTALVSGGLHSAPMQIFRNALAPPLMALCLGAGTVILTLALVALCRRRLARVPPRA